MFRRGSSELHLMLHLPLDPHAELRAALAEPACGALSGFTDFVKIGGRDITTMGGGRAGSASQHGACSFVYKVRRRNAPGSVMLALKVMLNYNQDRQQSTAIRDQFSAEHDLLTDLRRLPTHGNIAPSTTTPPSSKENSVETFVELRVWARFKKIRLNHITLYYKFSICFQKKKV
jgi:hypothetical protein